MKTKLRENASTLVMSVFVIAMLSTLVMGILQMNVSEIQLMQSRVSAAQALAVAEAGLNAAMAQIRNDPNWTAGFEDEEVAPEVKFGGGRYSVTVNGNILSITATINAWQNYTATMEAQITVSDESPHIIRIDNIKVNEPFEE